MKKVISESERESLASLRFKGFAVIVWNPEELGTADPRKVEDRSIELGYEVIRDLQDIERK